jgi:hypothetical protein
MSEPTFSALTDANNIILDEIIREATFNADVRARFLSNPKAVLRERGAEFPETVQITVHEFDIDDRHIFLPPLITMTEPDIISADLPAFSNQPDPRGRPPGAPSIPPRSRA